MAHLPQRLTEQTCRQLFSLLLLSKSASSQSIVFGDGIEFGDGEWRYRQKRSSCLNVRKLQVNRFQARGEANNYSKFTDCY